MGGRPLIVGGGVRDHILDHEPKDVGIEVYFASSLGDLFDTLERHLCQFGNVNVCRKAFGVIKLRMHEGEDLDFYLPRRDNKWAVGHKGFRFSVQTDASLTPEEAAKRRDFTFNSLAWVEANHPKAVTLT